MKALTRDEQLGGVASGKLLCWLETYAIDESDEGAYLSAAQMAERLGMAAETVEGYRRELLADGLLEKLPSRRGARSGWRCTLPADCIPSSPRPRIDELKLLAGRLAASIASERNKRNASVRTRLQSVSEPGSVPGSEPATSPDMNPGQDPPLRAQLSNHQPESEPGRLENTVGEVGLKKAVGAAAVVGEGPAAAADKANGNGVSKPELPPETTEQRKERYRQMVREGEKA